MNQNVRRNLVVLIIAAVSGYPSFAAAETARHAASGGSTHAAVPAGPFQPSSPLAPTVLYRFPLRSTDWWHTVNYVDLDPGPGFLDWACGGVSYDGSLGHDIILRDFVEMDEGRFVLAAAPGTVGAVFDGNYDRNISYGNFPDNEVVVDHADGSYTAYWNLAKWSTLVYVGQTVKEGQPLGLVGSSGYSSGPHLTFATGQSGGIYEPSAGACNAGSSHWKAQLPHVYLNPAAMYDFGVTSLDTPEEVSPSRPPNLTHIAQTGVFAHYIAWYKITDLHIGDTVRIVWIAPDSSVYSDTGDESSVWWRSYYWQGRYFVLPQTGFFGTWTVQFFLNGIQVGTRNFVYDTTPEQNPVATGRTVGTAKGVAKGALNGSDADSDVKEFTIATYPAHGEVKLSGPRGRYFSYVSESGFSGADTWDYRVTDGQGAVSANGTMTMNVSPVLENALRLEGEDDYVSVPPSASLNATSFTYEAWIRRAPGSSGWQGIFTRRPPDSFNSGVELFIRPDSRLHVVAGNGTSNRVAVSSATIPLDRWVHVAATLGLGFLRVYIDGTLQGSTLFPGGISYTGVGEMRIGGSFYAVDEYFRGEIEEARIWNVARDATQLAQGASCAFFDSALPSSVKGWWRFQGNANDSSPNANHGSLVAGASFLRTDSAFPLTCLVQNLDGDSLVDGLDNCPLDANNGQDDADADGVGDPCDLCPTTPSRAMVDSDRDGVGDRCDNCPFLGNTEQVDADGDGAGDLCDPAPASSALSVPSDQITLALSHNKNTGITTVGWTPGAYAASYEFYRGSQDDLQDRFYGTCQNSRDGIATDTAFAENETPPAGTAFYFLVIGVGSDGTRGLAGVESNGRQRDLRAKDCN